MTEPATARVDARVNVLLDPTDDAAVTAGLLARHDPAAGVVVVHPTPGGHGSVGLAHDVLAALGFPPRWFGENGVGSANPAWHAVTGWLTGDRIVYLVMLRAHRLPPAGWTDLVAATLAARATLLLVCHTRTIPRSLHKTLIDVQHQTITDPTPVLDRHEDGRPRPARRAAVPRLRYPALPRGTPTGQVLHYRADVFRRFPLEQFAKVDDLYGRGLDDACRWLAGREAPPAGAPSTGEARLQRFLTELVHDSPTPQHTLARLRGAQAGFLLHGSWLSTPALTALCGPGLTSTPVTAETVQRIRAAVAHPVLAAGVALAMFTGISLGALRTLRVEGIAPPMQIVLADWRLTQQDRITKLANSLTFREGTAVFFVPLPVRPLLRAARTFLLARSPDLRQRLFASLAPALERITDAAARCGLTLPAAPGPLHGCWQIRASWTRLGEALHTPAGPDHPQDPTPGRSCLTARPPAAGPAPTALPRRHPYDRPRRRWSPLNPAPRLLPGLLRAHLDNTIAPALDDRHRRDLVQRHLAVWTPPTESDHPDRIAVHPDVTFGLRLTDQPGPPEPKPSAA